MNFGIILSGMLLASTWALQAADLYEPDKPNRVVFPATEARFVRLVILDGSNSQPCIDELEVYGPEGRQNLALATSGAKANASSLLKGYPIHQVAHLNDGRYGNSQSWIAAGTKNEWAEIELPTTKSVSQLIFSRDREGKFQDRMPERIEVRVSTDGASWKTVAKNSSFPSLVEGPLQEMDLLRYAFDCENLTWQKIDGGSPLKRVFQQMEAMISRFSRRGMDVNQERTDLALMQSQMIALEAITNATPQHQELFFRARLAKRQLFLREPDLAALERVLFVKRHPYEPSHNYSVIFDAAGGPGGAVCVLEVARHQGRLAPGQSKVTVLFDAKNGIVRDPVANFDASKIYFGYTQAKGDYFHLWMMNPDGSNQKQISEGPFHDYFPCPLPDGGLGFISTRCKARFICWRPQAFVLFRMDADGNNILPLSHANLSEWTPSIMNDGRLIWMRSEYLDKGADFGHTLWAIHPDGSHPELIFGNNTLNCYANGREVPGSNELLCTLVSHGGDLNGPIALIDSSKGRFNPEAIRNITPDVQPHYHMSWAKKQCFRDPFPISHDYYLCSHAPFDKFGLYLIDRYGNRELLYLDPVIGSMSPTLLRTTAPPVVLPRNAETVEYETFPSRFVVADVYRGLEPHIKRGSVKFLRVCQEVRADLKQLPNKEYQKDHEPFQDWYASPTHKVAGPNGWPSYSAKGDLGIAPVEEDGSANFYAPSGKVLYFQALDENFNELQRMRSVVQLQPGEQRSCIGCHEHRMSAPPATGVMPLALRREPSSLQSPPWGSGPFAYEKVVQPVWDANCVRCHDKKDKVDLTGTLDTEGVPASYRYLIEKGWVHYFDYTWGREHSKAQPLTFGTLQSKLWRLLDAGHYDTHLNSEESRRVKCWVDLNCPLWPDYIFRPNRPSLQAVKMEP